MRIVLAYPNWDNRWIPYFKKELAEHKVVDIISDNFKLNTLWEESIKADLLLSMWASEVPQFWARYFPNKKIITYLRSHELFQASYMKQTKWQNVDAIIFVNDVMRQEFNAMYGPKPKFTYYIPNAVDTDVFAFIERPPDEQKTQIAFVCTLTLQKSFNVVVQILMLLGDQYKVHYIGKTSNADTDIIKRYLKSLDLGDRWIWNDAIPAKDMPEWYKDKHFVLSTSVREGNPNCDIEGMAMGLKPIVHDWPGARQQFGPWVFRTVAEAADMITSDDYQPETFREWVKQHYSMTNITKLHDVIKDVMT